MEKVLEVPEHPSFVSSHMSARTENKLLDRIVKLGIGFLLPPVIITFFSIYAYLEMKNRILLVCPVISVVSFLASLSLIQSAKEARNLSIQASKQMFYSLYLMHLCAACYFFVGFCVMFLFRGEELLSKVNFALLAIEGGGIKYIIGYFFLFITAKKLTVEYQTISSYLQVIQLTLSICGVCIFFTSFCYQSRWTHLDIAYHVPAVILNLGVLAGVLLTVLTILTFYAASTEKLSVLLLSQVLTLIFAVFLFMLTGMLHKSNSLFIQVIEENCDYLLKIIDKDLLNCQKYTNDDCGEALIAFAWDSDGSEKCINTSCCLEITQEVVLSLQILMAWTLLSAVLLLFSSMAGQGLIRKIERFGRNSEKRQDLKAVACLVLVYLIAGTSWIAFIDTDVKLTQNSPKVKVLGAENLNKMFLPSETCRFVQIEQEIPENSWKVRVFSKNGQVFPSEVLGNKKKIQKELKKLKYCPEYISPTYEIHVESNQNSDSTVHVIQETVLGFTKVEQKAEGTESVLPSYSMDPFTLISQNESLFLFDLPEIGHAYKSAATFEGYQVSYVVGGLYPTMSPFAISPTSKNFTLTLNLFHSALIELYQGFNSFTEIFMRTQGQEGELKLVLPSGLYTLISYSHKRVAFKKNLSLFASTTVNILSFPSSINEAFTVQLLSNSSHLSAEFQESPTKDCDISLKYPRCGGSRVFRYKDSEIFAVKEVSASHYLLYVTGSNFEQDSLKFYSKGFTHEHFEMFGKKTENAKFWMAFCVNGKKGVNSLKVLDFYSDSLDLDICSKFYGNLTWSPDSLKRGFVRVEK